MALYQVHTSAQASACTTTQLHMHAETRAGAWIGCTGHVHTKTLRSCCGGLHACSHSVLQVHVHVQGLILIALATCSY